MEYTVITGNGRIHVLSIKTLAETYVKAYGGVIVTASILETKDAVCKSKD
jgi:hypothetical protein